MSKSLVLLPVVSEKAYASSQAKVYVFKVPLSSNSATIAEAVNAQFKVNVLNVRTLVQKGKPKRTVRKRQRPSIGHRSDYKKAFVTIDKKDSINLFGDEDKKTAKKKTASAAKTKEVANKPVEKKSGLRRAFSRSSRQVQNRGGEK